MTNLEGSTEHPKDDFKKKSRIWMSIDCHKACPERAPLRTCFQNNFTEDANENRKIATKDTLLIKPYCS